MPMDSASLSVATLLSPQITRPTVRIVSEKVIIDRHEHCLVGGPIRLLKISGMNETTNLAAHGVDRGYSVSTGELVFLKICAGAGRPIQVNLP